MSGRIVARYPARQVGLLCLTIVAWPCTGQADLAPMARREATIDKQVAERRNLAIRKYTQAGLRHLEARRHRQAAAALATVYVLDSQPRTLLQVADTFRAADLPVEALAVYRQVAEADPHKSADVAAEIEQLNTRLEDADFQLVQRLREYDFRGSQYAQAGDYQKAVEIYAALYAMQPFSIFLFNIGQGFRRSGRAEEALSTYRRFLRQDPASPLRKEALGYVSDLGNQIYNPPLYRRPWFWGVVGSVVVATGVGLGLGLTLYAEGRPQVITQSFPLRW